MESNRTDVIAGLRELAQFLEDNRGVPTPPDIKPFVKLGYGHTFTDVLNVAELLAPCVVQDSSIYGDQCRELVRSFGNGAIVYRVAVDAAAVGETRNVTRPVAEFIVDSELLRVAADGPVRRTSAALGQVTEQQAAAASRPTTAAQQAEAVAATNAAIPAA